MTRSEAYDGEQGRSLLSNDNFADGPGAGTRPLWRPPVGGPAGAADDLLVASTFENAPPGPFHPACCSGPGFESTDAANRGSGPLAGEERAGRRWRDFH